MKLKIYTLLTSIFILAGCSPNQNYDYLMEHPEQLEKAYALCRSQQSAGCDEVVRAAEDFRSLVEQHNENPERMGLQIMRAQQQGNEKKVRIYYAVLRATSEL